MKKTILIVIILLAIIGGWFSYKYIFSTKSTCWPYCPNMTDQDRENIKKSAQEAENLNQPVKNVNQPNTDDTAKKIDLSDIKSDWNNTNRTISKTETTVNINFEQCTPDMEVVYVALGSTHIVIKGKEDNKCIMYYGGEVENPNYNGSMTKRCEIPTDTYQQFPKEQIGVDFSEIDKYCSSL